jgi:hypothetical protein
VPEEGHHLVGLEVVHVAGLLEAAVGGEARPDGLTDAVQDGDRDADGGRLVALADREGSLCPGDAVARRVPAAEVGDGALLGLPPPLGVLGLRGGAGRAPGGVAQRAQHQGGPVDDRWLGHLVAHGSDGPPVEVVVEGGGHVGTDGPHVVERGGGAQVVEAPGPASGIDHLGLGPRRTGRGVGQPRQELGHLRRGPPGPAEREAQAADLVDPDAVQAEVLLAPP